MRWGGTNPSARLGAGTSPFRGGFAWRCAPQKGSLRGRSQGVSRLRTRDFASAEATKGLCDRPLGTFAPCGGNSCKVAAALSAAVTTTNSKETALTLRRNQARRNVPHQTPAALRERGVWGERRFSQRSGLSPQNLSFAPPSQSPRIHSRQHFVDVGFAVGESEIGAGPGGGGLVVVGDANDGRQQGRGSAAVQFTF